MSPTTWRSIATRPQHWQTAHVPADALLQPRVRRDDAHRHERDGQQDGAAEQQRRPGHPRVRGGHRAEHDASRHGDRKQRPCAVPLREGYGHDRATPAHAVALELARREHEPFERAAGRIAPRPTAMRPTRRAMPRLSPRAGREPAHHMADEHVPHHLAHAATAATVRSAAPTPWSAGPSSPVRATSPNSTAPVRRRRDPPNRWPLRRRHALRSAHRTLRHAERSSAAADDPRGRK